MRNLEIIPKCYTFAIITSIMSVNRRMRLFFQSMSFSEHVKLMYDICLGQQNATN